MRKPFYSIMAATFAAITYTTLSCKNGTKEQPTPNVEQADTTATNPTATAQPEQQPKTEANKPGDRPTFQLVGNVKTCKWKNAEANDETVTYAFDEQGNLTTINGRKENISRNKQGLIERYALGENELTSYLFSYDADGRVKKSSMSDADSGTDNYTYKYNAKGFVSSRYCKGEISEMGADEPITYEENVTYDYTKIDEQGNWTKRTCHGATGRDPWTETRTIVYY